MTFIPVLNVLVVIDPPVPSVLHQKVLEGFEAETSET